MIDQLHYISQASGGQSHLEAMENALKAGVKWVQLRVKDADEAAVLELARTASNLCHTYKARLIVNDFPEIALRCGAWGVHLGLDDMPVAEAREILGLNKCIGGTANTFTDIVKRVAEGVNYIGLGPYRFTKTKKKLSPVLGLAGYKDIMGQVAQAGFKIPIIAIGGIDIADVAALKVLGLHGVAVSGALTFHPQKQAYVQSLYTALS